MEAGVRFLIVRLAISKKYFFTKLRQQHDRAVTLSPARLVGDPVRFIAQPVKEADEVDLLRPVTVKEKSGYRFNRQRRISNAIVEFVNAAGRVEAGRGHPAITIQTHMSFTERFGDDEDDRFFECIAFIYRLYNIPGIQLRADAIFFPPPGHG
jgi:hypothetical protein